jgi:hypothetical protein
MAGFSFRFGDCDAAEAMDYTRFRCGGKGKDELL